MDEDVVDDIHGIRESEGQRVRESKKFGYQPPLIL